MIVRIRDIDSFQTAHESFGSRNLAYVKSSVLGARGESRKTILATIPTENQKFRAHAVTFAPCGALVFGRCSLKNKGRSHGGDQNDAVRNSCSQLSHHASRRDTQKGPRQAHSTSQKGRHQRQRPRARGCDPLALRLPVTCSWPVERMDSLGTHYRRSVERLDDRAAEEMHR